MRTPNQSQSTQIAQVSETYRYGIGCGLWLGTSATHRLLFSVAYEKLVVGRTGPPQIVFTLLACLLPCRGLAGWRQEGERVFLPRPIGVTKRLCQTGKVGVWILADPVPVYRKKERTLTRGHFCHYCNFKVIDGRFLI